MRIRKRKVPLPLSLLSPVPLSDPHLFSRSPVMVVHGGASSSTGAADNHDIILTYDLNTTQQQYSEPSDHLTPTCSDTSASDLRRLIVFNNTSVVGFGDGEGLQSSNDDVSNASITAATTTTGAAVAAVDDDNNKGSPPLSYNEEEGRWCDGDKAIPLKKRRGINFNNLVENSSTIIANEKDTTTTMVTAMMMTVKSNNCDLKNNTDDNNGDDNTTGNNNNCKDAGGGVAASVKKGNSKRGNTIMEGSRCSRVNGRGWRCCQPTLVGYSLCEHHLGKGRLRSMASSNNAKVRSTRKKIISSNDDITVDESTAKKVESMSSFGNKRVKLGVVKARSLSSLLGQTNTMNNNIVGDHANMQQYEKINSNLDYQ